MKILELKPISGQKSFYKKALVKIDENVITLQSYQTDVARIYSINDEMYFERGWSGYSATSQKHIASFVYLYFGISCGKKEWQALELHQPYKVVSGQFEKVEDKQNV